MVRPRASLGVALDRDGALLVADDVGNAIWRVTASLAARYVEAALAPLRISIVEGPKPKRRQLGH
jgi:hypothetical protein